MEKWGKEGEKMYSFEYVDKSEWAPVKREIEKILHKVQDLVRPCFNFSYTFVGSASRNMITCDKKTNIGFDFDVNIYVNDDENQYSPKELKEIMMDAVNRAVCGTGYSRCENSTRVITLKFKDMHINSIIHHSCDMAIVNDYIGENGEKKQEYIRFNKKKQTYMWVDQPKGFNLEKKISWLKNKSLWDEVREIYLYKKNTNTNPDKHSCSLFAETINEVCIDNQYIGHH